MALANYSKKETPRLTQKPASQPIAAPAAVPTTQPQLESPKPVRKDTDKSRESESRRGCRSLLPGCGCRSILFGGCLSILIAFAALIYVLIAKPPAIYDPLKQWLNVDLVAIEYDGSTPESVIEDIKFKVKKFKVGENELILKESQMRALLLSVNTNLNPDSLNLDIDSGSFKIFLDIEEDSDVPLWLVVELGTDADGELALARVGTERIGLPSFVNRIATDLLFSALSISGQDLTPSELIKYLLPFGENVDIKDIEFQRDKVSIIVVINTGLE